MDRLSNAPQVEVGTECSAEYLGLGDTQVGELFQGGPCSLLWSAMDSCCWKMFSSGLLEALEFLDLFVHIK